PPPPPGPTPAPDPGPAPAATPPQPASPEAPTVAGPPPLAAAHEGAGTFLIHYHHEMAFPFPAGVLGVGLRWRRSLVGVAVSILGHSSKGLTQPERSVGARISLRLYPKDLGRVAPYAGVGVSLMVPTVLPRVEGGVEIALGSARLGLSAAFEANTNEAIFFATKNGLIGLSLGWAL
ncbi:MAG: hypothetical protein P1V51_00005, partial [Deltaproteobacteria bacterium]|nr:hypothetical protein [Deltaproteobacteria bacterium]